MTHEHCSCKHHLTSAITMSTQIFRVSNNFGYLTNQSIEFEFELIIHYDTWHTTRIWEKSWPIKESGHSQLIFMTYKTDFMKKYVPAYFSHDPVVVNLETVNNWTLCLASSAAMIGSNWLIYFTSQLPKTIKIRNKGISEIFRTIVKVNKYLCEYFVHRSWKCKKSVRARQMPWHDMELKGCRAVGSSRARQSFNTIQLKTKT